MEMWQKQELKMTFYSYMYTVTDLIYDRYYSFLQSCIRKSEDLINIDEIA